MHVTVIAPHTSRYPDPIRLPKGAAVQVDVAYAGMAEQDHWMFCRDVQSGREGWIHEAFLQRISAGEALLCADYSAFELNVQPGDGLMLFRTVGGWGWCMGVKDGLAGWVPQECMDTVQP